MINNAEFFFNGGRVGVLLIHGLTGTPNEMRVVGKGLHRAGFTVYGMQLAGHCGNEQDLRATSWQNWYRSVEIAADVLCQKVDYFFVAGLSMGALLALKLAADRPTQVLGIGVYGPTFRYDGWSIPFYARKLFFMLRIFHFFRIFQDHVFVEQPPFGLKDERLRATVSASMLNGDSTVAGLAGNPYPALAEMQILASKVRKCLPLVKSPCLIIHAEDDDIANISNSFLVRDQVKGPTKLVVLKDSYHLITIDRERKEVVRETINMFRNIVIQRINQEGKHQSLADLFPARVLVTP